MIKQSGRAGRRARAAGAGGDDLGTFGAALRSALGADAVRTDALSRMAGTVAIAGYEPGLMPSAVVCPRTVQDVATVVRACSTNGAGWVVRGGGSDMSLPPTAFSSWRPDTGFGAPTGNPIVLVSMEAMTFSDAPDPINRSVRVGAGLTFARLAERLAGAGASVRYEVACPETMTIGGALARGQVAGLSSGGTGFDGTCGTSAPFVNRCLAVRGVLPDGREASARADVAASGLIDPVALLLAGAGTGFIVCEAELEVAWAAPADVRAVYAFATLGAAIEAVEDAANANQLSDVVAATAVSPAATRLLHGAGVLPEPAASETWYLQTVEMTAELLAADATSRPAAVPGDAQRPFFGTPIGTKPETPPDATAHHRLRATLDGAFEMRLARMTLDAGERIRLPLRGWVPVSNLTRLWRDLAAIEAGYACSVCALVSPMTGELSLAVTGRDPDEHVKGLPVAISEILGELRSAIEAREGYVIEPHAPRVRVAPSEAGAPMRAVTSDAA
jgi:FAD/FMN-containing dehydrogenase